ncbi:MAG: hypothetical protein KKE64_07475, partial [Candidatus Omnitrophica bacterium]|nr:hypothetical protein [Candidatus Omnitrophota bacterium]
TTFNHSVDYKYIYAPPLIKTKYLYGGEGYFFNNTFSFIEYFLNCFLNLNEHLTSLYTFLTFLFMIFGSFVILFFKDFRKNLEKEVWIFFISYIVVFFAVSAFYSPLIASRTVVSAIPILLVFLFAKAIYYISKLISRALIFGVSLLIALSFIIFCPHNNIRDYASYKPLFDYVEKLPKNALLAGTIRTLEPVPFFSHRPVFYMTVYSTMPTNGDFYNEVEKRKRQLLEALYGDSLEAIKSLVKSYGITHMVIEKKYFGSDFLNNLRDPTVHGLYIGLIKEIINKNKKRSFPVLGLTEISDFNYRDIVVVDAKKILNYIEK